MKIYTVTAVDKLDLAKAYIRCIGFFTSLNEAIEMVESNCLDIAESGINKYCIIEEVEEGFYGYAYKKKIYKYNVTADKYEEIERPKEWERICNFGIG